MIDYNYKPKNVYDKVKNHVHKQVDKKIWYIGKKFVDYTGYNMKFSVWNIVNAGLGNTIWFAINHNVDYKLFINNHLQQYKDNL
jgi:hypothetical protein